jgi:hypothetical protein
MQGNSNKTKQKGLHFLLFAWPNRDFSKGCGQKNKKIGHPLNSPSRLRRGARKRFPPTLPFPARGLIRTTRTYNINFFFTQ